MRKKYGLVPNSGNFQLLDVHGAGALRNDPKSGDLSDSTDSFGPQGDGRYVFNSIRGVRDVNPTTSINESGLEINIKVYPNPSTLMLTVETPPKHELKQIEILDLQGRVMKTLSDKNNYQTDYQYFKFSKRFLFTEIIPLKELLQENLM